MAMPFALIKGAVNVAIGTKKLVDFLKTSDEEGFYLWRMLDALAPAMAMALYLRR